VSPRTQDPPRRLNRAQKRKANQARILVAARRVFGKRGYHGASIEQIADEAGLSNGAIYYNFDSKGDLFLALLEERTEERIEHMRRTIGRADGARNGGLAAEARDATRSLKQSRDWRMVLLEFEAHAIRTPSLARKLKEHKRRLRSALAELLDQRATDRGSAPPMPADDLALAILGLANGLAIEELADPGAVSDDLLGDALALLSRPRSNHD
jgi:AcrR family transcriptional regulator